jgi:hypothetical protein
MYYVIRLSFNPGAGYVWAVAYAGADRPEARAAFDLVRLDGVWSIRKALVHQQPPGLALLDSAELGQPRGREWPGWFAHA